MSGVRPPGSERASAPEYTITGIISYLQSEWQRMEREKIQWDIEKAEMRSRIAKLEEGNRRVLYQKVPQNNHSRSDQEADSVDMHLAEARLKLANTVGEIKSLLDQSGMMPDESPLPVERSKEHLIATLANFGSNTIVSVSIIGQHIAAVTGDGMLLFWDIVTPNDIAWKQSLNDESIATNSDARSRLQLPAFLQFVESESLLISAGGDGMVKAWSLTRRGLPSSQFKQIGSLESSPTALVVGGGGLVAVATGSTVKLWSFTSDPDDSEEEYGEKGLPEFKFGCHVTSLAFSASELLVGLADARILVASSVTGDIVKRIAGASPDEALSVCPPIAQALLVLEKPTKLVVIGMATGDIRILALPRGEVISELPAAHRSAVTSLSPSPNSDSFLSAGKDGTVALWSLVGEGATWRGRLLSHDGGALCSNWSTDFIAVGGADAVTRIYKSP